MKKYIKADMDREQQTLFRKTLEETLPKDHPVRMVDKIIDLFNFDRWDCEYSGGGRPSYAPWDMCKLLIYGNMVGIRSSRKLEYACLNNRDFIWLMRGLAPDHDTIASFRSSYKNRFKEIFSESIRIGIEAGIVSMKRLAVDGTRVLSNSSRWGTMNMEGIENLLSEIDDKIEKMLEEAEEEDREEDDLFGKGESPNRLPEELTDLEKQRELLKKAYEKVKKKEERARRNGEEEGKKRVPVTDPDSDVMRSKTGDFAPNYNVHLAVDCDSGMIVSSGVDDDHNDEAHLRSLCDEAVEKTGKEIEQVLADSSYASTPNLEYLDSRGIDAGIPAVNTTLERERKVRNRPWPESIEKIGIDVNGNEVDGSKIPLNTNDQFDKSAFKYDEKKDIYICPMGHAMHRCGRSRINTKYPKIQYKYQCGECGSCQFKPTCAPGKQNRSVSRDSDAKIHETQKLKMEDPGRRESYKLRRETVEPAFGILKAVQSMRQFLTRGAESVKNELCIATIAFNVRILKGQITK